MPTTYYLCCCCYYTYYHLFHHRYCYSYYILAMLFVLLLLLLLLLRLLRIAVIHWACMTCIHEIGLHFYDMNHRSQQFLAIVGYCSWYDVLVFSMIILHEIVAYAVWTYSFEGPKILRAWRSLNCLPQIRLTQWYNAFSKPSHEIGLFWPTPQLIWAYMSYMRCRCQTRLTMDMTLWICKAQSKPLRGESGLGPNYQHQTDKGTQRGDTLTVNEP